MQDSGCAHFASCHVFTICFNRREPQMTRCLKSTLKTAVFARYAAYNNRVEMLTWVKYLIIYCHRHSTKATIFNDVTMQCFQPSWHSSQAAGSSEHPCQVNWKLATPHKSFKGERTRISQKPRSGFMPRLSVTVSLLRITALDANLFRAKF